jgi:hypothetical protein
MKLESGSGRYYGSIQRVEVAGTMVKRAEVAGTRVKRAEVAGIPWVESAEVASTWVERAEVASTMGIESVSGRYHGSRERKWQTVSRKLQAVWVKLSCLDGFLVPTVLLSSYTLSLKLTSQIVKDSVDAAVPDLLEENKI